MAICAIWLYALYFGLAVAMRMSLQLYRTGSTGLRWFGARQSRAAIVAGTLLGGSLVAGVTAPILDLAGFLEPVELLEGARAHQVGLVVFAVGLIATLAAQLAMGDSWRIGVAEQEKTSLVTGGPFGIVRNPIYSALAVACLGLMLLVPNPVALTAWLVLVVALQMQVRRVEEPHLLRIHGASYADYAARVGRFVPRLGRREPPLGRLDAG
jgi:protein-S-isoprenylcysteine O-methyltransferase Ste14